MQTVWTFWYIFGYWGGLRTPPDSPCVRACASLTVAAAGSSAERHAVGCYVITASGARLLTAYARVTSNHRTGHKRSASLFNSDLLQPWVRRSRLTTATTSLNSWPSPLCSGPSKQVGNVYASVKPLCRVARLTSRIFKINISQAYRRRRIVLFI